MIAWLNPTAKQLNVILFIWILSIPFRNAIYQVSTVLILLLAVISIIRKKHYLLIKNLIIQYKDILTLLVLIIGVMYISSFLGENPSPGYNISNKFVYRYGLIFIVLIYFYKIKYINKINTLYFILIALLIQGLLGVHQHFTGFDILKNKPLEHRYRIYGGTSNPNPFGFLMAIGSSIIINILVTKEYILNNKKELFCLMLMLLLFLFNMLYTYSRSSWVMFSIFLIAQIIFINNKNRKHIIYCFSGLSILILSFIFTDKRLSKRLFELISLNHPTNRARIYTWIETIDAFIKKPIFGYGLQSYDAIIDSPYSGVHNCLLEVLLYTGIVGFIFCVLCICKVFIETRKNNNSIYVALFFSLLTVSQFDHSPFTNKIFLTTLTIYTFILFSERIDRKSDCKS